MIEPAPQPSPMATAGAPRTTRRTTAEPDASDADVVPVPVPPVEPLPERFGRVAIVHYWLVNMRGGERVLEALCDLFPGADLFTTVLDRDALSAKLAARSITPSFVDRLPFAKRLYKSYLPLMPLALEQLDLSGYDLVISSESGPAKYVIPPPTARHVCYVHSPMRYLWDHYHEYRRESGWLNRLAMSLLVSRLRVQDVVSATRVDAFVANSNHVASRIERYWRRDAEVVHPPVDVDAFRPAPAEDLGDFYLWAGELVGYKRPDVAIEAAVRLDRPLKVIGDGPALARLRARHARAGVQFLGRVDFDTLRWYMAHCRALLFPGEEDFGMVPVEVMASGRPVVALGRGGALDTVVDGVTGVLYPDPGTEGLVRAIERFETDVEPGLDAAALTAHARSFSLARFRAGMERVFESVGAGADGRADGRRSGGQPPRGARASGARLPQLIPAVPASEGAT